MIPSTTIKATMRELISISSVAPISIAVSFRNIVKLPAHRAGLPGTEILF